uniref:Uncharacterized protein n=1 Tax=Tetranychus urticae TaxID=32264 RepID=T1K3R1_TETUR
MKCSSCWGFINIKDQYYFDKQLKFHCEACCGADAHQSAIQELMKCDTCDSTARWTCLCHFMNHCNSCLLHVHENGLNNGIQRLFANSHLICEECNLITSDYTNKENGKNYASPVSMPIIEHHLVKR